jgi:hypothetical protein
MPPQPIEVEETVDGTQHVSVGNVIVQPKLIEQALLHHQLIAHHRFSLPIHQTTSESAAINRHNSRLFSTVSTQRGHPPLPFGLQVEAIRCCLLTRGRT